MRDEYTLVDLSEFEIKRINYVAAAACDVDLTLMIEEEQKPGRMRWIRESEQGEAAMPNQPGEWRFISWGPFGILNQGEQADA